MPPVEVRPALQVLEKSDPRPPGLWSGQVLCQNQAGDRSYLGFPAAARVEAVELRLEFGEEGELGSCMLPGDLQPMTHHQTFIP